jgi:hypothetical protein
MGATSLAKVTCGCAEFATAFDAVCALALVAINVATKRARIVTGSDFRKDVIAFTSSA